MSRLKKRRSAHAEPEERQGSRDRARSPGMATLARSEKPGVISVGARVSGVFYRRGARVARGVATEPPGPFTGCELTEKQKRKVNGTAHRVSIFCRCYSTSELPATITPPAEPSTQQYAQSPPPLSPSPPASQTHAYRGSYSRR